MKSCLMFLFFHHLSALPTIIRIGGIFGQFEESQELAFRYAVESINMDLRILANSKLHATIVRIPPNDSFHASKKVCQLMRSGVAAIFGPKTDSTANHVQSICDALEIPHIETRWKYRLTQDAYSVNLYPHSTSLSTAYYDVINALGWTSFTILYDSNAALIRLKDLLKAKAWHVHLCELKGSNWRSTLKDLKKLNVVKLVLDVSQEKIYDVLKQAAQVGLMGDYYSYLITSLDMNIVDMDEFRYEGTNITALRLVDPTKEKLKKLIEHWSVGESRFPHKDYTPKLESITTESALMYDAVYLFARALADLDRSRVVDIVPLHCDLGKTWSHGNSLINLMKWYSSPAYNNQSASYSESATFLPHGRGSMAGINQFRPYQSNLVHNRSSFYAPTSPLHKYGESISSSRGFELDQIYGPLTGLIKFDKEGFRSDFELQITELDYDRGLIQVGVWTRSGGANYSRQFAEMKSRNGAGMTIMQNITLVVTSALSDPYTMVKKDSNQLTGNDRYEGFCIDLIDIIFKSLKFQYEIKLAPNNSYGKRNNITGEYDGMIGELLNKRADLAIVDFTMTYERAAVVDFSLPFMDLGIGIIYQKPQKMPPSLFSFLSPFSAYVWMSLATAYLGVSVLLFILARISPNEWDNPSPCIQDPDELENAITLSNAFWFTIGSLMQQGSDIAPKAVSTRVIASIWWFFTLIMISTYTANLSASLAVENVFSPINGVADLLSNDTDIQFGCKKIGSTASFFRSSNSSIYQAMQKKMLAARPTVFMESNSAGVDRVKSSNGKYAFLMESASIEYAVERQCELTKVGGLLDSKSYGIALRKDSPLTELISTEILKLKEMGVLSKVKTKWWKHRRGGGRCTDKESKGASKATKLGLANVGGVFVVLIGGMGVSALFAFIEFIWNVKELATDENTTFCDELGKEMKFILKCSGNTKAARKANPSTPEEPLFIYGSYNTGTYDYQPTFKKIPSE